MTLPSFILERKTMLIITHRTRLFILNEKNEFLIMVRNFKGTTGKDSRVIMLPGGGIDDNETSQEAIIRETYEELGITLDNVEEVFKFRSTRPATAGENIYWPGAVTMENHFDFYKINVKHFDPVIKEKEKFDKVVWGTVKTIEQLSAHYNAEIGDGILDVVKLLSI